jgi:hypothetical protein
MWKFIALFYLIILSYAQNKLQVAGTPGPRREPGTLPTAEKSLEDFPLSASNGGFPNSTMSKRFQ